MFKARERARGSVLLEYGIASDRNSAWDECDDERDLSVATSFSITKISRAVVILESIANGETCYV